MKLLEQTPTTAISVCIWQPFNSGFSYVTVQDKILKVQKGYFLSMRISTADSELPTSNCPGVAQHAGANYA
jgi:hypothetical protein